MTDDVFAVIAAGCTYSWQSFADTSVDNGEVVVGVSQLQQCQTACINNPSCTGIDVTSTGCWLHGPWSGNRNDGNRPGVTHYDISRNCPREIKAIIVHIHVE